MTNAEIIRHLTQHNQWRRGDEIPMLSPKLIGEAIDGAIAGIRELERIKRVEHVQD